MTPLLAQRGRADRAFERMYKRFATDVYRYAYGVLRNPADAEDVAQTTFMNAYRALERGEDPRQPLNWLITIAHNVCRQRFRAAARRPQEVGLDFDVAEAVVDEEESGPSQDDIKRALGHLAFNQRAAIVLREIEGRSYAEIAEVLGMSVSAVETLIFRARRALREQLEGALTCAGAELAISKQLDRKLSRAERSQLRAHLRECPECATYARRQRAQRTALKAFGAVPLPSSLAGLLSGGATIGISVAAKTAAVVVVASAIGAGGYGLKHELQPQPKGKKHAVVSAAPPVQHAAVVVAAVDPVQHRFVPREREHRGAADGHDHAAPAPTFKALERADGASQDVQEHGKKGHAGKRHGKPESHGQRADHTDSGERASFSAERHHKG